MSSSKTIPLHPTGESKKAVCFSSYNKSSNKVLEQGEAFEEESEEKEPPDVLEYFVFLCECCGKKYATKNEFLNHSNSKKHKSKARIYEEVGLIVTHVELRGEYGNEKEEYNDDDDDSDDGDRKLPPTLHVTLEDPPITNEDDDGGKEEEDDDNIDLDELIYQNQLIQNELDTKKNEVLPPTPLAFEETYDPENYGVNENRLASVQHRLRENLAAKGIEPSSRGGSYEPLDAITTGKTLLQQVMEANIDTLQHKLDAYNKHKEYCELMSRQFALAKGNSKALSAQYIRKNDVADNARRRTNIHHAGSHYHMQAARSMQFGRSKGMIAGNSSQGARLQASRMATKGKSGGS